MVETHNMHAEDIRQQIAAVNQNIIKTKANT